MPFRAERDMSPFFRARRLVLRGPHCEDDPENQLSSLSGGVAHTSLDQGSTWCRRPLAAPWHLWVNNWRSAMQRGSRTFAMAARVDSESPAVSTLGQHQRRFNPADRVSRNASAHGPTPSTACPQQVLALMCLVVISASADGQIVSGMWEPRWRRLTGWPRTPTRSFRSSS